MVIFKRSKYDTWESISLIVEREDKYTTWIKRKLTIEWENVPWEWEIEKEVRVDHYQYIESVAIKSRAYYFKIG